jgi:hypothetical protein
LWRCPKITSISIVEKKTIQKEYRIWKHNNLPQVHGSLSSTKFAKLEFKKGVKIHDIQLDIGGENDFGYASNHKYFTL